MLCTHPRAPQASSWLLTCFAADFPLHFAGRVMDVLLTGHQVASPVLKVRAAAGGRAEPRRARRGVQRRCGCAASLPHVAGA